MTGRVSMLPTTAAVGAFPRWPTTTLATWGRGHDGLVNCVRTGMSKSVSISKTCVAANAIYSNKVAGHDALVSTFVATYE